MLGDFNAVLGAHEKLGGRILVRAACLEFSEMIEDCDLSEITTKGSSYT